MGVLKDLKLFNEGTSSELDIRDYILENMEEIEKLSARELGKVTYTSAATVVRFCNKLGYKGYSDFKIKFISELKSYEGKSWFENIEMKERENVVTILRKITEIEKKAILDTEIALSFEQLKRIREKIHKSEIIDFYVYDTNIYIAEYASNQFLYSGKKSTVYTANNMRLLNTLTCTEKNLAIIISQTGENEILVEFAKLLKKRGIPIIVITTSSKTTLAKISDEYIFAATTKDVEAFLNQTFFSSVKYILDILWGLEYSLNFDKNIKLNKLFETIGEKKFWKLLKSREELKKNI